MKKTSYALLLSIFLLFYANVIAQPPAPNGYKWVKNEAMSDEFNGGFNKNKWDNYDPSWKLGRAPGLFRRNNVAQWGGELRLEARKLTSGERRRNTEQPASRWKEWTHGGAIVRSLAKQKYGYFETRFKANETFMSSTFWLIHTQNLGKTSDCTRRTTEADITETVGQVMTKAKPWVHDTTKGIFSAFHTRDLDKLPKWCRDQNPSWKKDIVQRRENFKKGSNRTYNGYHTYGLWWKGPREMHLYMDGQWVGRVTPSSDFNIPMSIRLVVETYDWNPAPFPYEDQNAGGMWKSKDKRTTKYSYVRTWKLVKNNSSGGGSTSGVPFGKEIAIRKSVGNKHFLQVNPNNGAQLASTGGNNKPSQSWQTWERFVVKKHPKGGVAIYSLANNKYLQVNGTNDNVVVKANGPGKNSTPLSWERFEWKSLGGNKFALKAVVQGNGSPWLQCRPEDNAKVFPVGGAAKSWETFTYEVMSNTARKLIEGDDTTKISVSNPVSNGAVEILNANEASYSINSLNGQVVQSGTVSNNTIGVPNLSAGIYIIQVSNDGKTYTEKIVIE